MELKCMHVSVLVCVCVHACMRVYACVCVRAFALTSFQMK